MNTCSANIGAVKAFDIQCADDHINRMSLPPKYNWLLNVQGFVDVPEYELLPGNMYATNKLVRFVKTS